MGRLFRLIVARAASRSSQSSSPTDSRISPSEIIQAVKDRLDKRIFGYTKVFDPNYYLTVANWTQRHYNWAFEKEHLVLFRFI
ncbi:hypothetical protein ACQKOM_06225 [Peribacillus frigoritolerans]|uniref:hypothetical protein n=1 Tax=Peribacillus frigoritolerans TaxID=450367 RepID=UPI003D09167D